MVFLINYITGYALEILALYTIGFYLFHLEAVNTPDPLTLKPWWRNNIVTRRDWLVGIPYGICALFLFSSVRGPSSHEAAAPSWELFAMFLFFAAINLSLVLSLALYRPTGLILFTASVMQSIICSSDSDPGPYGWTHPVAKLLWLIFPILCMALWFRALQSLRRRSRLHKSSITASLPLSEG